MGKTHGFWGFLLKSSEFSRFPRKLYKVSGSVTFMYVFLIIFGRVKQGALDIARTRTGKFCPGSLGIPFRVQVVEQKEPPTTFLNFLSQMIVVIPESAFWKAPVGNYASWDNGDECTIPALCQI